jgi:hypothetical protein
LPGRPKDNHYKNSDQRVSVPTETFNLALLAYLEEEEEWLGGKGGQRCGTSASAAVAICAFTKCIFISITGLQDEMNIQMSRTT